MTTYSKITDYAAKDVLLSGNPAKAIKGTEIGAEFDAIAAADATSVKSGGALGTPSSGTLTNCTGLPAAGVSGTALVSAAIGTTVQAYSANLDEYAAVNPTAAGLALLDDASAADQRTTLGAAASGAITSSGLTQATARLLGRTTASTGAIEEISVSGATLSGGVLTISATAGITVATAQATTSGTAFDFTGIPAGTKRVVVMFNGVSLSGTDHFLVQIGDSGGIETSGYIATSGTPGVSSANSTAGFIVYSGSAGSAWMGQLSIDLFESSSNTWNATGSVANATSGLITANGYKPLSATLDRVRVTRTGTDTFDAGSVTIAYES